MAEPPYIRNATVRKLEGNGGNAGSSPFVPGTEPSKVCAYNQTRERFLSVDVEAADFTPAILNARLPSLTSGCGQALWIVPFRGISPTSVRFPIDLVYLNADGIVLCVVDSFPFSDVPASSAQATSLLALPAQSISTTGTCRGDQLLLCPQQEMKQRLQQLAEAKAEAERVAASGEAASAQNRAAQKPAGNVLPWVDRSKPASAPAAEKPGIVENSPAVEVAPRVEAGPRIEASPKIEPAPRVAPPAVEVAPAPDAAVPAVMPEVGPSRSDLDAGDKTSSNQPWAKRYKTPKNWFQKLISSPPADPRRAPRLEIPWLGAYFFTGGKPVAYTIRDISATGMYVITEERWYPGTVIRVTLTDRRQPTRDRSFTINAKVVRPANDGVGLQFVLNDGSSGTVDSQVQGVDREQVEFFLQRMRS
jgi:uncharacterized protein